MLPEYEKINETDLRIRKTARALIASMSSLLSEFRFSKLTVDGLCKTAQLSRAAFYSHFTDKYNLLEFWLLSFWTYKIARTDTYENVEQSVNKFVNENKKIIKNLLIDADHQTLEIVLRFLCYVLDIECAGSDDGKLTQRNVVAANLYTGGLVHYLSWQARNNFPPDTPVINEHSFGAIKKLRDWAKEQ